MLRIGPVLGLMVAIAAAVAGLVHVGTLALLPGLVVVASAILLLALALLHGSEPIDLSVDPDEMEEDFDADSAFDVEAYESEPARDARGRYLEAR